MIPRGLGGKQRVPLMSQRAYSLPCKVVLALACLAAAVAGTVLGVLSAGQWIDPPVLPVHVIPPLALLAGILGAMKPDRVYRHLGLIAAVILVFSYFGWALFQVLVFGESPIYTIHDWRDLLGMAEFFGVITLVCWIPAVLTGLVCSLIRTAWDNVRSKGT